MSFDNLPPDTDEKALRAFLRRIEYSLEMINRRLKRFEEDFGMDSEVFYAKLQNAELEERLEYAEWAGTHEMQQRLLRQRDELRRRLM
ncbi:MAG: hypothetical protein RMK99_12525 [Anaerolineales bacterium]|nr:hypothetical protein [Anaerolineales bacterium]